MRPTLSILLALLLIAAATPVGSSTSTITVRFTVDYEAYPVPTEAGTTTCTVTVAEGDPVATLLDQAAADGCISGWTWSGSQGDDQGRFITSIHDRDGHCETLVVCYWWAIEVDGEWASQGVDHEPVEQGRDYSFTYTLTTVADWF